MIFVTTKGKNFLVTLDRKSPYFKECYTVLASLLSSYESSYEQWLVDYDDFLLMKQKLDILNLTEDRIMDKSANDLLAAYQSETVFKESLKTGSMNYEINANLGGLKTDLYGDQLTGVSYLVHSKRAGLLDSMGSGKTIQVLATIVSLGDEIKKTLIIAPLSVVLDFEDQIKQHTNLKSLVIPPGKAASLAFFDKHVGDSWDVLLVHPENLVKSEKGNMNCQSSLADGLMLFNFDMIVVDEFHLYKNIEAKRSVVVSQILKNVKNHKGESPRAICMTGTLVSESPNNAYLFLQIMGSHLPSFAKFEKYFSIFRKIEIKRGKKRVKIDKVVGYKNLEILRDRIARFSIRRTKADLKGFPDQIFATRKLQLTGSQRSLYLSLLQGVMDGLPENVDVEEFFRPDGKAVRLRQILNHPALIEEGGDSVKYEELDSLLEELLSDKAQKVVIWTEYRAAVDLLYNRYNELYGVQKLYGGVDITEELKNEFVYGDKIRIAACIPAKAGTGVDFLARARTAIYVDRPYSLTLDNQSVDRIHRRVKTDGELSDLDKIRSQPATIIYLECAGTLDELVRDRLLMKKSLSDSTMAKNHMSKRVFLEMMKNV